MAPPVDVDAVDRAAAEIASRRFECVPCKHVFKNEHGLKSHLKFKRHEPTTPLKDVPQEVLPALRPDAGATPAGPPIAHRAVRVPSEKMLGHLFGLIFVCFAILLASRAVALTDEEEELTGEIWQPICEDYKDDPALQWLFCYLPIMTAVAATCSIVRNKYEAYHEEKKTRPAKALPPAAAAATAPAAAAP